jgi:hypothetical protein
MGHGYSGESKSDKAYNRMDKAMERSARQAARQETSSRTENPIITQLKQLYPDSWKEQLKTLQRDWAAKQAAGDTSSKIKSAEEYEKQVNRKL